MNDTPKDRYTTSTPFRRSPTQRPGRAAMALLLAGAVSTLADPGTDQRAPEVPAPLRVPAGNRVAFHAFAAGVQIYVCRNISTIETPLYAWVFKAPEAVLTADEGGHGIVGIHYAGPTWESSSGSKVVGARMAGATVAPASIPWLLLRAVSTDGAGVFADVTYIQRVNTVGGLAPATGADAEHEGQEVGVPYTAEYYFYRASQH